jgi:tubulin polyglutamylase TTLL6/13
MPLKKMVKKKASPVVKVNTSSARSGINVLRHAISLRPGVYEETSEPGKGNILWSVQSKDFDGLTNLKSTQCVSRLPGMASMCHKVDFARAMAADDDDDDSDEGGDEGFWPKTWILPDDAKQLKSELRRNGRRRSSRKKTYIFKPDAASQGDGIVLLQKSEDLRRKLEAMEAGGATAVVQEYIDKPLLLDGCKFDLRIYVLVLGHGSSPHVFICKEGIARLCVQKYEEPAPSNLHKVSTHLTNYSINSVSAEFDRSEDGSKRLMSSVLDKLHVSGAVDKDVLWGQICESVSTTVQLMVDAIEEGGFSDDDDAPPPKKKTGTSKGKAGAGPGAGKGTSGSAFGRSFGTRARPGKASASAAGGGGSSSSSAENSSSSEVEDSEEEDYPEDSHFQVLGFDVLMDQSGCPILLEVNSNPSLKVDAAYPVISPTVVQARARSDALRQGAWDGEKRFFEREQQAQVSGSPGPGSYDIDDFMRANKGKASSTTTTTTTTSSSPSSCKAPSPKGVPQLDGSMNTATEEVAAAAAAAAAAVQEPKAPLQVPFESQNGKYKITAEAEAAWLRTYGPDGVKAQARVKVAQLAGSAPAQRAPPARLKVCGCMSHYMPHVHIPSPVDLTAKGQAILGTLDIVRRWQKNSGADAEDLVEGTEYVVL